jgi:hypothetical protein
MSGWLMANGSGGMCGVNFSENDWLCNDWLLKPVFYSEAFTFYYCVMTADTVLSVVYSLPWLVLFSLCVVVCLCEMTSNVASVCENISVFCVFDILLFFYYSISVMCVSYVMA